MKQRWSRVANTLMAGAMVVGCGADNGDGALEAETDQEVGSVSQPVAACAGDDVNYDFNAFAASLAVAIANELGRWDVSGDFQVLNGKLELSPMGLMRCNGKCNNIAALLRLQDDSASVVPNHSPSIFRSKLTSWYQAQAQGLATLVSQMLYVNKGIYRLKVRHSGKYMAVSGGSVNENAAIEQKGSVAHTAADRWRIILDGTAHRFVNMRSDKCLAMSSDSNADGLGMVQQTCSTSSTQLFHFAQHEGYYWILDKYSKAIDVNAASLSDDVRVIHWGWSSAAQNQQWTFEPYGSEEHVMPTAVASAMYQISVKHSGKSITVDNSSLADGALLEQATYSASNDAFHWYVLPNGTKYQLVNRHSSKCMALVSDSPTSPLNQQTCDATASTQLFDFNPVGSGNYVVMTKYGTLLEVEGASTADDTVVKARPIRLGKSPQVDAQANHRGRATSPDVCV